MKSRKVKATEKKKMFMKWMKDKKISSDDDLQEDNSEEMSSDDDDYQKASSEEEEVLPITDDENDVDEEEDSDVDEEEGLPNRDAWGKKKSAYYHADFVDQDRGKTYREEDAEKARAEEEEALFIQRNIHSFIGASALGIPELEAVELPKEELVEENIKSLDKEGKLKYLKKKCPEMFVFIKEFKEKASEINNKLLPILELIKNGTIQSEISGAQYIKLRYQLLLHYCLNICFYMYMKSNGYDPSNHPVLERINTYKAIVEQSNDVSEKFQKEIEVILEKLTKNEEIPFVDKQSVNKVQPQNERRKAQNNNGETVYEEVMEDQQMDDGADGKRMITYQIAKNKGLHAKRKKECRNPRVHHRMKFKKAKIRRKGQVREAVKEVKRYDGEPTGISTHIVRSIKIK